MYSQFMTHGQRNIKLRAGRYVVRMPADVGNFSLLQDVKNVSIAHPATFPKGIRSEAAKQ